MFCKKGVLKNFTKLKGKHLCRPNLTCQCTSESLFNKVAGKKTVLKVRHVLHSFQQFVTLGILTE